VRAGILRNSAQFAHHPERVSPIRRRSVADPSPTRHRPVAARGAVRRRRFRAAPRRRFTAPAVHSAGGLSRCRHMYQEPTLR